MDQAQEHEMFDGAAGGLRGISMMNSLATGERFLQNEEILQQQPQQPYYPPPPPEPQQQQHQDRFYYDKQELVDHQIFNQEVLSRLHGFGGTTTPGAKDVAVSDAMASFGFNSFLFLFLMIGYEFFSRVVPSVYASRKLHVSDDSTVVQLPKSILPLAWVPKVLSASWESVRKSGGLDSYFFLRFIRLCFRITFVSGIWGTCVLWPVFASGGEGATGFYYFSMANVPNSSWRLWFPTCFMIFLTIYVLYAMRDELMHYLEMRMMYLAEGDPANELNPQAQRSLIVEELPKNLRSDMALYEYFDKLFPGQIHSACVVLNIPELDKLSAKRKRVVRRLEKSIVYHEATGMRGTHIVGQKRFMFLGIETFPIKSMRGKNVDFDETTSAQRGERVDSINYYTKSLEDLNEKITTMQNEAHEIMNEGNIAAKAARKWVANVISTTTGAATSSLSRTSTEDGFLGVRNRKGSVFGFFFQLFADFFFGGFALIDKEINAVVDTMSVQKMSATGFVTFNNLTGVTMAAKIPLSDNPDVIKSSVAPDPRDIIWKNAHVNLSFSKGRELTANFCIALGALLWSTIVASIQSFSNIEYIAGLPGFGWIRDGNPHMISFVNGYLPVVALLAIISVLPTIFAAIGLKFESRKTKSDIQRTVLGRYFYYQLANIYITVTSGSIWMAFSTIVDHPGSIFAILGRSLPTMVGFFISLLMTKTMAGLPMKLLQLPVLAKKTLIKTLFRQKFLTQREIDGVYKKEYLDTGVWYPDQLLVIVICFTYACISPIILPVGAIYFLCALVVYKKQVLLVYAQEFESGGSLFPSACRRTLVGLILSQCTLIGYTAMRQGLYQPLFLIPLPFYTYNMMKKFDNSYIIPSSLLSLDKASDLDVQSMVKIQFDEDLYRQPVLAEKIVSPLPYRVRTQSQTSPKGLGVFSDDFEKKT